MAILTQSVVPHPSFAVVHNIAANARFPSSRVLSTMDRRDYEIFPPHIFPPCKHRGQLAVDAGLASAEDYPSRPVHVIVNVPAGLAPDVLARLIAEPLSHRLGREFFVENKPGAGGNVGAEYVIRAAPDGYTLLVMISGNAANTALYPNLGFDFVRDVAPIAFLGYTPFVVVVHPSVPARTLPELIAHAKANPGKPTLLRRALAPRHISPSNCSG